MTQVYAVFIVKLVIGAHKINLNHYINLVLPSQTDY